MTKVTTGANAVVLSVNGYNKFIVDGSASARVSTNNDVVNLTKSKYRGEIAMYVNNSTITPINFVDMEQYLYSVVPSEMPGSWSVEALKAQSVAARTYTTSSLGKHGVYDLCDTVHCQSYNGINNEYPNSTTAVQGTAGKRLYSNNKLIDAVYFLLTVVQRFLLKMYGITPLPYLVGKKDNYEKDCKNGREYLHILI